jgi:hypothetical protein
VRGAYPAARRKAIARGSRVVANSIGCGPDSYDSIRPRGTAPQPPEIFSPV